MLRRIGLWALCGLAVALIWAGLFYILGPSRGFYPSQGEILHALGHSLLLRITVPVALLGQHHAMTWYWSAVMNAAIYGCAGLAVETIRSGIRSSRLRVDH